MLTSVLDSKRSVSTLLASSALVAAVASAFFGFENLFHTVLANQFPAETILHLSQVYVIYFMLFLFAIALITQLISPMKLFGKNNSSISMHLRNGLYINSYFDKLIGAYKVKK
jgi:NAD(P)H-quinone oxidoreductase subunit 5